MSITFFLAMPGLEDLVRPREIRFLASQAVLYRTGLCLFLALRARMASSYEAVHRKKVLKRSIGRIIWPNRYGFFPIGVRKYRFIEGYAIDYGCKRESCG